MPRRYRKTAGFSLVELLLVVAIMGIITAMMIPSAMPSVHDQLEGVAQILAGDIAYARNLAVAGCSTYRLTFDTVNNQYILTYTGTNPALVNLPPSPFRSPTDPANQQIVRLAKLPQIGATVNLFAVYAMGSTTQTTNVLDFGPLGQTTQSATTVVWLSAGTGAAARYMSVQVNPITGLTWIGSFQSSAPTLTQGSAS